MKKILLVCTCTVFLIANRSFAQQHLKSLYFYADTACLNKMNTRQVLDIRWTTPFHYSFVFYPEKQTSYNHLEFSIRLDKNRTKPEIQAKRPSHIYISLEKLLDIAQANPKYFNDIYDLNIIEVLPGKKFRTYKVMLIAQSIPIKDYEIIRNNN